MILKDQSSKIYFFLLLFTAATLPFKVMFNNIAIGLLIVYWLVTGNLIHKIKTTVTNKYFLLFASVYLIQLIGLLYSTDVGDAFSKLEKRAGLLLLPLITMSSPQVSRKQLLLIILAFTGACCVLFSYALFKVLAVYGAITNVPQITEFIDDTIHLHHAYSGLYLVFGILTMVFYTLKNWQNLSPKIKAGAIFLVCILYFFLLLLGARMALFIPFLGLGFPLVLFAVQKRNVKSLAGLLIVLVVGILGVLIVPSTRAKLNEFIFLKGVYSPFTPRLIQWSCCFNILQENKAWLQGVGTGDVKPKLQACYQERKFWGHLYNYNAHNEYLEEMVRHGFIGLSIFLLSLLYPLVISIKRKQPLYTCFLIVFMFVCISESVLNRQKGVIFYSFFNALFITRILVESPKKQTIPASINN